MKKIILFSSFIFCFSFSKAQGNLQFNQVILYDIPSGGIQAINVPAGKVWKIESTGLGTQSTSSLILRNSSAVNITYIAGWGNYSCALPLWLPSSFVGSFQQLGNAARAMVSIIEFNVVP